MAVEGITRGAQMLRDGGDAGGAIESAIREAEDFPCYKPVGYGRLPNGEMEAEMDTAFMDGNTLDIGVVVVIKGFANPVSITRRLNHEKIGSLLVARGTEKFTHKGGFEHKNMLINRAKVRYRRHIEETSVQATSQKLEPCPDHDIIGVACPDMIGRVVTITSTSGPLMKRKGGVRSPPISGSGFCADSRKGTASATGLGEDLMRGCISYGIVCLMGGGMCSQEVCKAAVSRLDAEPEERRDEAGDLSIIATNLKGEWDMATNMEGFPLVVVTESQEPTAYLVTRQGDGRYTYGQASDEWMEDYMETRMALTEG